MLIDQIKKRLSLIEIVREYLADVREQSPGRFVARCPFHHEDQNASLLIEPAKGTFYCFGCQQRGDIIDFYKSINKLSAKGAISALAKRAGIKSENPEIRPLSPIKKAFQSALSFYQTAFWKEGSPALAYMKSRGIGEDTLKRYGVGYSPSTKSMMAINKDIAIQYGILAVSKKGIVYDPLFGRVVFPIFAEHGENIAFSGRILPDGQENSAKYKNTCLSELFRKGENLFGLSQASESIKKHGFAVLVEGHIDVLALADAGVQNAVGTMGTSVTVEQMKLLSRYTQKVLILMDGDEAGTKAGFKAIEVALHTGMLVKVANLEDGLDPASLVSQPDGLSRLRQVFADSQDGLELWLKKLEALSPFAFSEGIRLFLASQPDGLLRIFWAKKIALHLGVTTNSVLDACSLEKGQDEAMPETCPSITASRR
jgi:DNA primase